MTPVQTFFHLYNLHGIGRFLPLLGASAVISPSWVRRLSVGVAHGDDEAEPESSWVFKFRTTSERVTPFSFEQSAFLSIWHIEIYLSGLQNIADFIQPYICKHSF